MGLRVRSMKLSVCTCRRNPLCSVVHGSYSASLSYFSLHIQLNLGVHMPSFLCICVGGVRALLGLGDIKPSVCTRRGDPPRQLNLGVHMPSFLCSCVGGVRARSGWAVPSPRFAHADDTLRLQLCQGFRA